MKEKSFTDLEQSKKLAEILPHESADMEFMFLKEDNSMVGRVPFVKDGYEEPDCGYNIVPCWSLTALLGVIPKHTDLCKSSSNENKDIIAYWCYNFPNNLTTECYDNPVDACVAMIEKLHELKKL